MNIQTILAAKAEAKRFNDSVNALLIEYNQQRNDGIHFPRAPKQSGALRRVSMDLTRSLAAMRASK